MNDLIIIMVVSSGKLRNYVFLRINNIDEKKVELTKQQFLLRMKCKDANSKVFFPLILLIATYSIFLLYSALCRYRQCSMYLYSGTND